ncbi:MAG: hypothetical protein KDJ14_16940, partial [Xanthomonadales bacterium]|nr:hypothetical protein [Xanthomonadales bacterium]
MRALLPRLTPLLGTNNGSCARNCLESSQGAFREHACWKPGCGQDGRFVGPLPVGGRLEEKP